jgi:hypothetical protein
MNIFIICSKAFYDRVLPIKQSLEKSGHQVTLPNCYDEPGTEDSYRKMGGKHHATWKAGMLRHSEDIISQVDAVLVLNFTKNNQDNYVGGATFLEMYDAFRLNKIIYLYNDIPEGILTDEIEGFEPVLLHQNLELIG